MMAFRAHKRGGGRFLLIIVGVSVLVGCARSRLSAPPDPPSLKQLLEVRWPIHTNPPDTNFHQVMWTNISLEWTCDPPPDTNWMTNYVTGLVWGPSPDGPWQELTNLHYALTNRVTIKFDYNNGRFFRAFNRFAP